MLVADGGAGGSVVGLDLAGVEQLSALLRTAGDSGRARHRRIAQLLEEAGAGSPALPCVAEAAVWAEETVEDLRRRADILARADGAWSLGGLRYTVVTFDTLADAERTGRALGEDLRRFLLGGHELGDEADYRAFYDELRRRLAAAAAYSDDPAFAAAYIDALGGLGTVMTVRMAAYGGEVVRREGAAAELVRPFDLVFAAATRSGRLDPEVRRAVLHPGNEADLDLLLWYGDFDPAFAADAARVLLVERYETTQMIRPSILWPHHGYPSTRVTALRLLARNPEAAHLFAAEGANYRALIGDYHDDDEGRLAARVLELALLRFPSTSGERKLAEDATERVIRAVAHGHAITAPAKLAMARVLHPMMGLVAEQADRGRPDDSRWRSTDPGFHVPRDTLMLFLTELMADGPARAEVLAGARDVTAASLNTGAAAVARRRNEPDRDLEFLKHTLEVGPLYGLLSESMLRTVDDPKQVAALLGATIRAAGGVVVAAGVAATPLTGGVAAGAGAAGGAFADWLAGEVERSVTEASVRDAESFLVAQTSGLEDLIVRSLYAQAPIRELMVAVPPPKALLTGGHLVVPDRRSPEYERFREWLEANTDLRALVDQLYDQLRDDVNDPVLRLLLERELDR
jgi:hypothetical protein